MNLEDRLDQVTDRASFFAFLEALIANREDEVAKEKIKPRSPYDPGANGWENGSIEMFLDAILRWSEDWAHAPSVMPDQPSWQTFAQMLFAGKHYE